MVASVGDQQAGTAGAKRSRLHEVFVSYSSRDKPVADAIVARLEQAGIRCWVAPRDVLPGMNWAQAIVEAIGSTRLMVVVLSGEANRSPQVLREVERAIAMGVVVIPFRIEAVEPTDAMAYYLASEHWLDALTPPMDDHIAALGRVVEAFLERSLEPAGTAARAVVDLDGSLNPAYPAAAAPSGRSRRSRWLRVAGGALAVIGIAGALLAVMARIGPDLAPQGDAATDDPAQEPTDESATDPPAAAAETGNGSSVAADDGSQALLDRLYRDCADGIRASCSRLWFEAEGHRDEASLSEFATDQLWRLSAIDRWGIDIPAGSLPTDYGSHEGLDQLHEECEAGDEAACTELLWESPPFSTYAAVAGRRFDHRPSSLDQGSLVSYWLVLTQAERAHECGDFTRDAARLVAEWEAIGITRDTALQFYSDHCGIDPGLD